MTALGIILLICALFLIVAVLLQQGKGKSLGGAISGGNSDTFFGKTKGGTFDKQLSKITTIVAIIFVIVVLIVYIAQDSFKAPGLDDALDAGVTTTEAVDSETVADSETETTEETTPAA